MKMKFKLQTLAMSLLLPICATSFAVDLPITGHFKTIKDVEIKPVAGHDMVINGLQMASGSVCVITTPAVANNWAGDTVMKMSSAGGATAETGAAAYGATTGAGCSTGTSVPGIYEIDGSAGAVVTIDLLASTSVGGLTFIPVGCASDYDGAADGDVCTPITAGGSETITLANTADQTVSAGNGQPEAGISRLVLAGQVTADIGLAAATPYTIPFDITVTY